MENISFRTTVSAGTSESACEFISVKTGLSKAKVKDAMNKGAVWLKRKNGKVKRLRRASAHLSQGDRIELYYDRELLSLNPPAARCMSDQKHYSVWFKPAGLLAQGTRYGDHCSLMRQAELHFRSSREIFPVHRLDREASGLMVLAHSKEAASKLSGLFQKNLVIKRYRIEVLGNLGERGLHGTIELPLDGKASLTEYAVTEYNAATDTSTVNVFIKTGRLHQIRRHFDMAGFPVMGDPRYGTGNKNTDGMKLAAVSLRFPCPFLKREVEYSLS